MTTAILRFSGGRHAAFTSSFAVSDISSYRIIGTEGSLRLEPAYQFQGPLELEVTIDGKTRRDRFREHDQFAPLLMEFSECVMSDRDPEPSGVEGLADVRIINALYESARIGRPVLLDEFAEEAAMILSQAQSRAGEGGLTTLTTSACASERALRVAEGSLSLYRRSSII